MYDLLKKKNWANRGVLVHSLGNRSQTKRWKLTVIDQCWLCSHFSYCLCSEGLFKSTFNRTVCNGHSLLIDEFCLILAFWKASFFIIFFSVANVAWLSIFYLTFIMDTRRKFVLKIQLLLLNSKQNGSYVAIKWKYRSNIFRLIFCLHIHLNILKKHHLLTIFKFFRCTV